MLISCMLCHWHRLHERGELGLEGGDGRSELLPVVITPLQCVPVSTAATQHTTMSMSTSTGHPHPIRN